MSNDAAVSSADLIGLLTAEPEQVTAEPGRRPRGRPRNQAADVAILKATIDELAESGFARLTMESVTRRAGVAKTTVYRRWSNKVDLVIDALKRESAERRDHIAPTGDLRKDLEQVMLSLIHAVTRTPFGRAVVGVVAESMHNDELREAYREQVQRPGRERMYSLLAQAVADGDLSPAIDVEMTVDFLNALVPYHTMLSGRPMDDDMPRRAVAAALDPYWLRPTEAARTDPAG